MAKDEAEKRVAPDEEVRAVEDTDTDQNTDITEDKALPVKDEQPTAESEKAEAVISPDRRPVWKRAYMWVLTHKQVSIPVAGTIVLLTALAAIPFTRYALAGMVLTQQYSVKVVDTETKQPVSSAEVILAGKKTTTDGRGQATVEAPVGSATLQVSKKYYKTASQDILVPIGRQKQPQQVSLVATGRQVPMIVINSITKKPVADVELRALDTKARTDKQGKAVLVVPAGKETLDVTVEAKGYNPLKQVVIFQQGVVVETSVQLVPAGKVYFLSNKSGKIDVVKANLDGSDRTVVLAGTGKENRYGTVLLASRDQKYLALLAQRESDRAKLYLIDTATDKLTVMDEGNAEFGLAGWSGHRFIYTASRTGLQYFEPKKYALKSYDAASNKIATLDETAGETKQGDRAGEYITDLNILDNEVLYAKRWSITPQYPNYYTILPIDKPHSLMTVRPDGSSKRVVKTYDQSGGRLGSLIFTIGSYGLNKLFVAHQTGESTYSVETYERGQLKPLGNKSQGELNEMYDSYRPAYYVSPKNGRTLWTEPRDGKNVFFLGDAEGKNEKQIGALSDFTAYGWYGEDYLLVSKKYKELYILPAADFSSGPLPQKITDYYLAAD